MYMAFMKLFITHLSNHSLFHNSFFSYLSVWVYMLFAYIAISFMLFVLARFSPYEWYNPHLCNPEIDTVREDLEWVNFECHFCEIENPSCVTWILSCYVNSVLFLCLGRKSVHRFQQSLVHGRLSHASRFWVGHITKSRYGKMSWFLKYFASLPHFR